MHVVLLISQAVKVITDLFLMWVDSRYEPDFDALNEATHTWGEHPALSN